MKKKIEPYVQRNTFSQEKNNPEFGEYSTKLLISKI